MSYKERHIYLQFIDYLHVTFDNKLDNIKKKIILSIS